MGWKFDTAPYKSFLFWVSSKLKELKQILKGLYGMLSNFHPLYLYREFQFRAYFGMRASLRILYKNMAS